MDYSYGNHAVYRIDVVIVWSSCHVLSSLLIIRFINLIEFLGGSPIASNEHKTCH